MYMYIYIYMYIYTSSSSSSCLASGMDFSDALFCNWLYFLLSTLVIVAFGILRWVLFFF